MSLGAAVAFPTAWAIGIAPAWFCLVGVAGAVPFLLTSLSLARLDRAATLVGAALAIAGGTLAAIAWGAWAPWAFLRVPALAPAAHASNGSFAVALAGVITAALFASHKSSAPPRRLRPAASSTFPPMGVRVSVEPPATADLEDDLDASPHHATRETARLRQ